MNKKTILIYIGLLLVTTVSISLIWGRCREKDNTRNIAIVRRFIEEVVNRGHFELVDELWAPDMVWRGGSMGIIQGRDNYKRVLKKNVGGAFTQMHLEIREVVASDDKVILYFTNSGINTGSFMGFSPTGKRAKWEGMGIYRITNGKITEAQFSEDLLAMFLQLGLLHLPE